MERALELFNKRQATDIIPAARPQGIMPEADMGGGPPTGPPNCVCKCIHKVK